MPSALSKSSKLSFTQGSMNRHINKSRATILLLHIRRFNKQRALKVSLLLVHAQMTAIITMEWSTEDVCSSLSNSGLGRSENTVKDSCKSHTTLSQPFHHNRQPRKEVLIYIIEWNNKEWGVILQILWCTGVAIV